MSFTYLHWKIAESLPSKDIKFDIRQMSKDEIKLLALNIFPQGKTAMHYLYNRIDQLRILYQNAGKEDKNSLHKPITVPMIRNF